jgi:glucose-1-phosphate thymidylyltransferase
MRTLGIILSAGKSSRLYPASLVATKQLLPVYDKPLIYYPLTTLMLAGIREFVIVVSPDELETFEKLFQNSKQEMGIDITFLVQTEPRGIADCFNIVGNHLGTRVFDYDNHALILGDNIFYGAGMSGMLKDVLEKKMPTAARIFLYQVKNPQEFGVAEIEGNLVKSIEEKPTKPKSNCAVTGLYIYPSSVYMYTPMLSPSARGELEISDLNAYYLKRNELEYTKLARGMVWFDTGNAQAMLEAANFIHNIQQHQSYLVGSPHEIAISRGWVDVNDVMPFIAKCAKTEYGKYLLEVTKRDV